MLRVALDIYWGRSGVEDGRLMPGVVHWAADY